jgi:hypothetical protein
MAHSGRTRHRDRDLRRRQIDEERPITARIFRITDAQRQKVAKCLRYIDKATRALEDQHNADNREIIRELRTSADQIFDLISGLEETPI